MRSRPLMSSIWVGQSSDQTPTYDSTVAGRASRRTPSRVRVLRRHVRRGKRGFSFLGRSPDRFMITAPRDRNRSSYGGRNFQRLTTILASIFEILRSLHEDHLIGSNIAAQYRSQDHALHAHQVGQIVRNMNHFLLS
ncbi:uncharacterized protein J3R85_019508 [Psidium guajava]|nr:uncharacterized protein J3R85_019508 [Psidium guajava]